MCAADGREEELHQGCERSVNSWGSIIYCQPDMFFVFNSSYRHTLCITADMIKELDCEDFVMFSLI